MTEKAILRKIDAWDNEDKFLAIIDFIDKLPIEEKTPAVLSEMARACNNIFWEDQSEENKKYLEKAVSIFKYIQPDLGDTPSWHYRIGYAYYYLNQLEEAKQHLLQGQEGNDAKAMLRNIEIAQSKGITIEQAMQGGKGGIEYTLEIWFKHLQEKAPELYNNLNFKGATDAQLSALEQKLGVELPEDYKQLYRTFNGQVLPTPFFGIDNQRFISLEEIEEVQAQWLACVEKTYGADWQQASEEKEYAESVGVKNAPYNPLWIPFLAGENHSYLCLDLDPDEDGAFGQVLTIQISPEEKEAFPTDFAFWSIIDWLNFSEDAINNGYLTYNEETGTLDFPQYDGDEPYYYTEEQRTALEAYIEKNIGHFESVFHEIESPDIHCDIYIVNPTEKNPFYVLVTGGMGAYPMDVPEDYPFNRAELMILLPPTWNIKSEDEKDYWPIRWLKNLARLPIERNTWLGAGHSIPTGDALEGTPFKGFVLGELMDDGGALLPLAEKNVFNQEDGERVIFYTLIPIYEEEMNYKLEHSADELFEQFEEKGIAFPPVVDIHRKNACEGFQLSSDPSLLEGIAWAFGGQSYSSLMNFWDDVRSYNEDLDRDLEYFKPFGTIFNTPKVKVIYEAIIDSKKQLYDFEQIVGEEDFVDGEENEVEIIAELSAGQEGNFGALELLWNIHNLLYNKELGDHIFFEGINVEGYEKDGTPVIYLYLGS